MCNCGPQNNPVSTALRQRSGTVSFGQANQSNAGQPPADTHSLIAQNSNPQHAQPNFLNSMLGLVGGAPNALNADPKDMQKNLAVSMARGLF